MQKFSRKQLFWFFAIVAIVLIVLFVFNPFNKNNKNSKSGGTVVAGLGKPVPPVGGSKSGFGNVQSKSNFSFGEAVLYYPDEVTPVTQVYQLKSSMKPQTPSYYPIYQIFNQGIDFPDNTKIKDKNTLTTFLTGFYSVQEYFNNIVSSNRDIEIFNRVISYGNDITVDQLDESIPTFSPIIYGYFTLLTIVFLRLLGTQLSEYALDKKAKPNKTYDLYFLLMGKLLNMNNFVPYPSALPESISSMYLIGGENNFEETQFKNLSSTLIIPDNSFSKTKRVINIVFYFLGKEVDNTKYSNLAQYAKSESGITVVDINNSEFSQIIVTVSYSSNGNNSSFEYKINAAYFDNPTNYNLMTGQIPLDYLNGDIKINNITVNVTCPNNATVYISKFELDVLYFK